MQILVTAKHKICHLGFFLLVQTYSEAFRESPQLFITFRSFTQPLMAVRVLLLFVYLTHTPDTTEEINLKQFFIFMSIWFYNLPIFDGHYWSSSPHCELSKLPSLHVSPSVKKRP